jgi:phage gp29-like protein
LNAHREHVHQDAAASEHTQPLNHEDTHQRYHQQHLRMYGIAEKGGNAAKSGLREDIEERDDECSL